MPAPRGFVQQLDQYLHRRPILKPKMRLLVACSGGADSVALLRLLHAINSSDHWGWRLVVGHVNHGLRGKQSDGDAAFVRQLAKTLKLPCCVTKIRMAGISEAEARHKRLDALGVMLKKYRLDAVVTAHHQDDQAETVLLRLLRGCGVRGAAGMVRQTRISSMLMLRPLLDVSGQALRKYLNEIEQSWREDASNTSAKYRRNMIRHQIMPLLKQINPDASAVLSRFAGLSRDTARALERDAKRIKTITRRNRTIIHRALLRKKAPVVRGLVLRRAIISAGGRADQIDFDQLQALIRAVAKPVSNLTFMFSGGIQAKVLRETIEVDRHRNQKTSSNGRDAKAWQKKIKKSED